MAHYQQLTIEEREKIQLGLWEGESLRSIACSLDRDPSTISRELKRNIKGEKRMYFPRLADIRAETRKQQKTSRPRLKNEFIKNYVVEKLRLRWSPEQIAGRLEKECGYTISHEAVYQFIYSQYRRGGHGKCVGLDLIKYLRRRHRRRTSKYVLFKEISSNIKNKVSIEKRPAVVERRIQFGHWETDSMVSRQSLAALNTSVERVSGYICISPIENTKGAATAKTIIDRLSAFPENLRRTITSDNGAEFSLHEQISALLSIDFYFCHPYASCERGTNENANGLVRDFFPKKTDFATVEISEIQKVEHLLNTRPRKRLKWKTPLEVISVAVAHGI